MRVDDVAAEALCRCARGSRLVGRAGGYPVCAACGLGTYSAPVVAANESSGGWQWSNAYACTPCHANSKTTRTGSAAQKDCICAAGYYQVMEEGDDGAPRRKRGSAAEQPMLPWKLRDAAESS